MADAVRVLLESGGYRAISYQEVASIAGVGRATVYRRWPTRAALTFFGISQMVTQQIVIADTGTIERDLPETLMSLARFLATPFGRAALTASLEIEVDSEIRHALWLERAGEIRRMFDRAYGRGQLPSTANVDVGLSMAAGSVYFRIAVAASHPDAAWIESVAASVLYALRQEPIGLSTA
ncbi:TetR/AcrR family transcriptional regulator [Pseudomonas yamanorum]|uniref:TetR/AcrR family transcriptional regulator n=1 Tax=Pseudomonas yamanorum TaxID=515393 RepID=A0A7Y8FEE7_9PSED|nr:TetR/AcrR family transcriptional regulator [Pseudomonas yamanorum]